jgi:hypothetical protein
MANHAGDNVEYWGSVPARFAHALYPLRKWPDLKMATVDGLVWLRGFSPAEVESVSVLSIPMLERYYLVEARLYPIGKSLPALIAPSLLWTDLRRGLKVRLPEENFNYFGVARTHHVSLVPSEVQREVTATIVDLLALGKYLHDAPRVRVASLRWTVLGENRALIMGTPLLPIQGQDYYSQACFLIPAGWKMQYERMAAVYQQALGDSHEYWYILNENNDLSKLRKADFNHLSKGAFVNTVQPQ